MKQLTLSLLVLATASGRLEAAPLCVSGSLQDYINLGSSGCMAGNSVFSDFANQPVSAFAASVTPGNILVNPVSGPGLAFSGVTAAGAGEVFESFFRFRVAGLVGGASVSLGGANLFGDGSVTATSDICAGGMFPGSDPIGCTGSSAALVAAELVGFSQNPDSTTFPAVSALDVFLQLTTDGGALGLASFDDATFTVTEVPEPSTFVSLLAGLAAVRAVRRIRAGQASRV